MRLPRRSSSSLVPVCCEKGPTPLCLLCLLQWVDVDEYVTAQPDKVVLEAPHHTLQVRDLCVQPTGEQHSLEV